MSVVSISFILTNMMGGQTVKERGHERLTMAMMAGTLASSTVWAADNAPVAQQQPLCYKRKRQQMYLEQGLYE